MKYYVLNCCFLQLFPFFRCLGKRTEGRDSELVFIKSYPVTFSLTMSRANRTTFLYPTIISATGSAKKKKVFVCIHRGSKSRLYQRLFGFRNYEIRLLRDCWIEWCLTQLRVRGIPLRTPLCAKQKNTHNHVRKKRRKI